MDMSLGKTVRIIGGTGKTGSRVVRRLVEAGHSVRVGSLSALPPFDWKHADTWKASLEGVDRAYIACYPGAWNRS